MNYVTHIIWRSLAVATVLSSGPAVAASSSPIEFNLVWNKVAGASHYQLEERDTAGSWKPVSANPIVGTSFRLSRTEGIYTYRVGGCVQEPFVKIHCGTAVANYSANLNVDVRAELPAIVAQFEFDARGRLTKVIDNERREVEYTIDNAGNRTAVIDSTVSPVITSFNATNVNMAGGHSKITWKATNATVCTLAVAGDTDGYENLPVNSNITISLNESTAISIKCFAGAKFASRALFVRVAGGELY